MSKQEDINTLAQTSNETPESSYLADLYTPEMVEWVIQQISCDFSPDLYAAYESETKLNADLRQKLSDSRVKVQRKEESRVREDAEWQRANQQLKTRNIDFQLRINAANDAKWEAENAAQQLRGAQEDLAETIEQQAEEMLKLKALLFDLQNA